MKRAPTLLVLLFTVLAGGARHLHTDAPRRMAPGPASKTRRDRLRRPRRNAHPRADRADLYRALGYAHAQDRLFQVELMRRLHAASWRNSAPSGSIPTACSAPCA